MTKDQQRINDLARWVFDTRKRLGLSQPDVNRRGGPSLGWIGELESGKMTTVPKRSTLEKLARGLGVPYTDVLIAAGEMTPGAPVVMDRTGDADHEDSKPGNHDESMLSAPLDARTKARPGIKDSEHTQHDLSMNGSLEVIPMGKPVRLPVYGVVSCGEPVWVPEQATRFLELPEFAARGAEAIIEVRGTSMVGAGFFDGDLLFVRRLDGERPPSGKKVIACIEGEYTCAVYRHDDFGEYLEKRPPGGEAERYPIKGETRIHALVVRSMRDE